MRQRAFNGLLISFRVEEDRGRRRPVPGAARPEVHVHLGGEGLWAPISVLCKVLEVSRSGFYAWEERGRSTRSVADEKLAVHVVAAFNVWRGAYGSPRVHEELKASEFDVRTPVATTNLRT